MMTEEAKIIIDRLGMSRIPHEGPWFVATHKSSDLVEGPLADRYTGPRYAYSAIYALMTREDFSAMHRLASDEMWHFYGGSPAEVLLLHPDGHGEVRIFGPDLSNGEEPQLLVSRGTWMGAIPVGEDKAYTFLANTLSPAFEYDDYEPGYRVELIEAYPDFADRITELTRADSISR